MFISFAMAHFFKNPWLHGEHVCGFWTNSYNATLFKAVAHGVIMRDGVKMLRIQKKKMYIIFEILITYLFDNVLKL